MEVSLRMRDCCRNASRGPEETKETMATARNPNPCKSQGVGRRSCADAMYATRFVTDYTAAPIIKS